MGLAAAGERDQTWAPCQVSSCGLSYVFLSWFSMWTWAVSELHSIFFNISARNDDKHCRHHEFLMEWWLESCWSLGSFHSIAMTPLS
jgi:hypothetical protein